MKKIKAHFSKTPDDPIFHYTDQVGLKGIIKNNCIWASKIHYLNDSTEFIYSYQLLKQRLNEIEIISDKHREPFKEKLIEFTSYFKRTNIFAASFSKKEDLLSQWRAYCPPTGGFSIGFNYTDFKDTLKKAKADIVPCIYEKHHQIELIDEIIIKAYNNFKKSGELWNEDWTFDFNYNFIKLAATLKHPSFKKEEEWRIVTDSMSYSDDQVDFRKGQSMLVPFFKFYLSENEKLNFEKIIVGPTPHPSLSVDSVRGLLFNSNDYSSQDEGEKVFESKVPYRTW